MTFMNNYNEIICFSHDTSVQTINGLIPISKIEIGMFVLTFNDKNDVFHYKPVEAVGKSYHDLCVEIIFENGTILKQTIDHPIYVLNKGWCSFEPDMVSKNYNAIVSKLSLGDLCFYQKEGSVQYIKLVKSSIIECNEILYCISASNSNNFFANGFLVHDEDLKNLCQSSRLNTSVELIH